MDIDTLAIAGPALGLAGILGYAAHRGGICAVKAVGELFTTRRTFMFRSFLKATAWVAAIAWPLLLWGSDVTIPPAGWEVDAWVFIGGFVFGIGATINRGCAFSTLARLADGNLTMLLALAGIAGGAAIAFSIPSFPAALGLRFRVGAPPETTLLAILGLTGLWLWCLWEVWRLWVSRAAGPLATALFGTTAFRLSVAAVIVGGINGVLIPLTGGWAYVGTIATAAADVLDVPTAAGPPSPMRWGLLGAALFGMVASSLQRGAFRLRTGSPQLWATPLIGGGAMGFGAALTPGGNEYLILQGIPCFSPHAFIGLLSLVAGIVAAMIVMRMFGKSFAVIDCSGDICRTRDA